MRLAMTPSASSHVAWRNWPLPLGPVRISGNCSRSSPYRRPAKPRTLAQMKPSVMSCRRLPSIFATLPSSTDTARLQASGQSRGHDVSTVL